MIDVYTWPTPNGHKVHIMLEETGLAYTVHPVRIGAGEQFKSEFLRISPNNKIPAIIDQDGPEGQPMSLFESGAILLYLASKSGMLLPEKLQDRWSVMQWLMFQMGGVGPMLGQAHHFIGYSAEKIPYAIERYSNEARRLYGVLDRRLAESEWVACGEYTIADIAIMPWLRAPERQNVNIDDFPNVKRWREAVKARPAVQRGLKVLKDVGRPPVDNAAWRENMFGARQYEKR